MNGNSKYVEVKTPLKDCNRHVSNIVNIIHNTFSKMSGDGFKIDLPLACKKERTLGNIVRIFAKEKDLESSGIMETLSSEYNVSSITSIPDTNTFSFIRRVRPGKSLSKMRRLMKRGSKLIKADYLNRKIDENLDSLFFTLTSNSTRQCYNLYFEISLLDYSESAKPNSFGLGSFAPRF